MITLLRLHEFVCVVSDSKRWEEAKDTGRVGTVEPVRFQPYLKSSHHLGSSACHVVVTMFRPVGQAITGVDRSCQVVYVDRFNDNY